ncbi:MAG: hypothetical protein U0792_08575 [Gemmataceae bacterium]
MSIERWKVLKEAGQLRLNAARTALPRGERRLQREGKQKDAEAQWKAAADEYEKFLRRSTNVVRSLVCTAQVFTAS